jgi:hypothetical protein
LARRTGGARAQVPFAQGKPAQFGGAPAEINLRPLAASREDRATAVALFTGAGVATVGIGNAARQFSPW